MLECLCTRRSSLTWTGEVATVLWLLLVPWRLQQWKSHSAEVGDPLLCWARGWWSLEPWLPVHSTVWVCTVLLSMELPCRDS